MSDIGASPTLTTLFTFNSDYPSVPDGLAIDPSGDLFGDLDSGSIGAFEIANTGTGYAGTLTVLTGFGFAGPVGSLVRDSNGNLFGTAGGTLGDGTVFELLNNGDGSFTFETVVNFNGVDGNTTTGNVILDSAGDLFGTTEYSSAGGGTVYEIDKTASGYASLPTTLYTTSAGFTPYGGLVANAAGDLFGEAAIDSGGGATATRIGVIYELTESSSGTYAFQTIGTLNSTGGSPYPSNLVIDSNGDLFGVTETGGAYGYGSVFELVKTATGYASNPAVLVSFYGSDGAGPLGLIMDAAGDLFGTTSSGGAYFNGTGDGTVFEVVRTPTGYSNVPIVLASFDGSNGSPLAGLTADAEGNLFGSTAGVPADYRKNGSIFEVTNSGYVVSCYLHGTRIATPAGERTVETLAAGDWVITAAGMARGIVWIGHRRLDCRQHPRQTDIWPVRVSAGAFGEALPRRDLFLSPDHAVFFEGALIPVRHLINDTTIVQEARDHLTYWHIELADHDILLAEGLPCESYLDTGNRNAFAGGTLMSLHPSFGATADEAWSQRACAPLVETGPRLAAARTALARRADHLGCVAFGVLDVAVDASGWVRARVPAEVHTVRLVCDAARVGDDRRLLGALLSALRVDCVALPLDDARLLRGFHEIECHGGNQVRWTDGAAALRLGPANAARSLELLVARACATPAPPRAA